MPVNFQLKFLENSLSLIGVGLSVLLLAHDFCHSDSGFDSCYKQKGISLKVCVSNGTHFMEVKCHQIK